MRSVHPEALEGRGEPGSEGDAVHEVGDASAAGAALGWGGDGALGALGPSPGSAVSDGVDGAVRIDLV